MTYYPLDSSWPPEEPTTLLVTLPVPVGLMDEIDRLGDRRKLTTEEVMLGFVKQGVEEAGRLPQ